MTSPLETIRRLKYQYEYAICDCDRCDGECEKCADAMADAILSLKRDIPREPVRRVFIEGEDIEQGYICPNCGERLVKEHHCRCGQRLLWQEQDKI